MITIKICILKDILREVLLEIRRAPKECRIIYEVLHSVLKSNLIYGLACDSGLKRNVKRRSFSAVLARNTPSIFVRVPTLD